MSFVTGQCPVKKYNRKLLQAVLNDRIDIAKMVNVQVVGLEDAVAAYADFDKGASKKYVLDPHGIIRDWFAKHPKKSSL